MQLTTTFFLLILLSVYVLLQECGTRTTHLSWHVNLQTRKKKKFSLVFAQCSISIHFKTGGIDMGYWVKMS